MKQIAVLLIIFAMGCDSESVTTASSDSSPYDEYETYSIKRTLDTARELQKSGTEEAIVQLKAWAKANPDDFRTIVMCRMLFKGKESPLRRPPLGGAVFLGGTTYDDWPLEPIAIFEGVPILITQGYAVGGEAEPVEVYLSYCIQEGTWVPERYEDKTNKQIKASLERFIAATEWKQELSDSEKQFLMSQAR